MAHRWEAVIAGRLASNRKNEPSGFGGFFDKSACPKAPKNRSTISRQVTAAVCASVGMSGCFSAHRTIDVRPIAAIEAYTDRAESVRPEYAQGTGHRASGAAARAVQKIAQTGAWHDGRPGKGLMLGHA